jgi:hypothetical protein
MPNAPQAIVRRIRLRFDGGRSDGELVRGLHVPSTSHNRRYSRCLGQCQYATIRLGEELSD